MAPMAAGGTMSPVDFKQKVITNVEHVVARVKEIAPQNFSEEVSNFIASLFIFLNSYMIGNSKMRFPF